MSYRAHRETKLRQFVAGSDSKNMPYNQRIKRLSSGQSSRLRDGLVAREMNLKMLMNSYTRWLGYCVKRGLHPTQRTQST